MLFSKEFRQMSDRYRLRCDLGLLLLEWQLPLIRRSNGWNRDFVVRYLVLDDGEMCALEFAG